MFSWVKTTAQSSYVASHAHPRLGGLFVNTRLPSFRISAAFGTAEPIYGPKALRSVAIQESENPTCELTKGDLTWHELETTNAETQTFYMEADSGHYGLVQVIYSNVA